MTDSVIACDACGQMVYANFAAKTLFGEIDMEKNSMDDCPEAFGIFDWHGERMLDPQELPLAQAAYEGKVVRVNLLVRQERSGFPGGGNRFPVLDRTGRQIGAMMVCRCLGLIPRDPNAQPTWRDILRLRGLRPPQLRKLHRWTALRGSPDLFDVREFNRQTPARI